MPSSLALSRPAPGELVAPDDRLDQRRNRLVRGLVGEVARGEPVVVGAQPVPGRLVGKQVEDERARAQVGLERRGDPLGRLAPRVAVRALEHAQRLHELQRLLRVRDVDGDRRRLLGEQAREGRAPRDVGLGQHPLLRLGELVRAVPAQVGQVVAPAVELIGGEELGGRFVVDLVPLQLEEQELGLDRRRSLADLHQRADLRRLRVHRERERGVGAGARRGRRSPRARSARPPALPRRARGPCRGTARRTTRRATGLVEQRDRALVPWPSTSGSRSQRADSSASSTGAAVVVSLTAHTIRSGRSRHPRPPRASDNVPRRWARCESSRVATACCSRRSITHRMASWTTGWSTGSSGSSSAPSPIRA